MTDRDEQFLKQVGIEPCQLDDPFPDPLREQEADPEQGFVTPKTLWEYLVRFPNSIRATTEWAAEKLGLAPGLGELDVWSQGITRMFIGFLELGLEDVVQMYPFCSAHYLPPKRPGERESERFRGYIRRRVKAALPVLLRDPEAF